MLSSTTAVILAAGEGKRFQPLLTPKPLWPFSGQPLISWIIQDLKAAGISRFVVVVSPKDRPLFKSLLAKEKNLSLATQARPTGMAGAVLSAAKIIKTKSLVVMDGADIISPQGLRKFFDLIRQKKPGVLLTGWKIAQHLPGGYFQFKAGRPVAIIEKPAAGKEPSPYLNLVLHYFQDAARFYNLLARSNSKKDDLYEVALSSLIKAEPAVLFRYQGYFGQLKYPWQVLDVMEIFLRERLKAKISPRAQIDKRAVIDGQVQIEAGAKIMANAVIKGPSYIGRNVIIGNNVLVRNSMISAGSVVGYNSEIARSYIGPESWFHCNYVGDSVIEGESNLGSGSRLANLRFDSKAIDLKINGQRLPTQRIKFGAVLAKGVKIGINASIMPGITVGSNSIIGAGVVLNRPVAAQAKVF
jgi:NDP-sugar pyrophosphorylase family protein